MQPTPTYGYAYFKFRMNDLRACEQSYQTDSEHEEWTEILWPSGAFVTGYLSSPDLTLSRAQWWEYPSCDSEGARSCYVIEGYTQDADGNPLDGCHVRAFTSQDGEFRGECDSNSSGFYRLGVFSQEAHFLMATRGGAPDLGGVSKDDVMPY